MFQIKICGITCVEDARAAVDSGADAIGLNFYQPSPRFVSLPLAREICAVVRGQASLVGLFVNHPMELVTATADELALDYVQLHGDEPVDWLCQLAPRPVIRAIRMREGRHEVLDFLRQANDLERVPAALLVDAYSTEKFGGTGFLANWGEIEELSKIHLPCPLILAGGLTAANVREAIERTSCQAVDVAGGVEAKPGRKDGAKLRQFVAQARLGFAQLESG